VAAAESALPPLIRALGGDHDVKVKVAAGGWGVPGAKADWINRIRTLEG
jgi:hypothetical protein